MSRWNQGRDEIDRLLASGELARIAPNRIQADRLLSQARRHLGSARTIHADDPAGAYSAMYDAVRKAMTALLENQGLRPTSSGGHLAVCNAARAQLDPPLGTRIRPFDRMRRRRRDAEYPSADVPDVDPTEVLDSIPAAESIISMVETLLEQMSPY